MKGERFAGLARDAGPLYISCLEVKADNAGLKREPGARTEGW